MKWELIRKKKKLKDSNLLKDIAHPYPYEIPISYISPLYFDCYNFLFRFENVLRLFVYYVLKSRKGKDWLNFSVNNESNNKKNSKNSIKAIYEQRKWPTEKRAYIGIRTQNPIMYLNLGELIKIIAYDKNRTYFNDYFEGKISPLIEKLNEINTTRNNLAHFREITEVDFERMKIIFEDLEPSFLPFLKELFCPYEDFKKIKDEKFFPHGIYQINSCRNIKLQLRCSKREQLVKIMIEIISKTISTDYTYMIDYINIDLIRLNKKIKEILPFIIYFDYTDEMKPLYKKNGEALRGEMDNFKMCFYSESQQFEKNYVDFFSNLEEILKQIEEDFRKKKKKQEVNFKILKKHDYYLSADTDKWESSFELPEKRYIEDWQGADNYFDGSSFLDFKKFPWLKEYLFEPNVER